MYTLNQTNSLYFYPHKIRFAPTPFVDISERCDRRFPGYGVSMASPKKSPQLGQVPSLRGIASFDAEKNLQEFATDRMDDDGARSFWTESADI
jgi:hypothetical protein